MKGPASQTKPNGQLYEAMKIPKIVARLLKNQQVMSFVTQSKSQKSQQICKASEGLLM